MKYIILLRHGEVNVTNDKYINANELKKWVEEYNNQDIKSQFSQFDEIENLVQSTDLIISSKLCRSIDSIKLFQKDIFCSDSLFDEAQIPLPLWKFLRLKPKTWLVMFRILWLLGYSKNCESYSKAKLRAKSAAEKLVNIAEKNKSVLLCGHGIMNRLIKKELLNQGFTTARQSKNTNWDYDILEYYYPKT